TLHTDGWSASNFHHFQGFSITAERRSLPVSLKDTTAERKTAELLLVHIRAVIREVTNNTSASWRARLIAFVTDNSGKSLSARNTIAVEFPGILCFPCYAHQINLIVRDYLNKCGAQFLAQARMADQLITWFRSHPRILGLLQEVQLRTRHRTLTIIRAVITRWIAHYLAYRHLLEVRNGFQILLKEDENRSESLLITGKPEARAKAEQMIKLIETGYFWHSLARAKSHLGPLAQAANILQASSTRLDHVPLVFGMLYHHFNSLRSIEGADADNNTACRTIISSVEKHWKAADQDIFIAAIILHPGLKFHPFNPGEFSFADIFMLMQRVYLRLFPAATAPPLTLEQNLWSYLEDTGQFKGMASLWTTRQAASSTEAATYSVSHVLLFPAIEFSLANLYCYQDQLSGDDPL
ncbi:uncharacterized protein PHACADRAFT_108590, partial [Phanerochaete carnosa HHB-10118-sp]